MKLLPAVAATPPAVRVPAVKRVADGLTVAVVLALPAAWLGGAVFDTPGPVPAENRAMHPPPPLVAKRWAAETFPVMFDWYFADRVGFRPEFLALRTGVLANGLGASPTPMVWVGRDGWLFMNTSGRVHGWAEGPTGAEANAALWAAAFRHRHADLAARGIRYVVLIARDKDRVYPEFLPADRQRHPVPDLVAGVRALCPDVAIVDTLPAELAAKATLSPLYYRTDTHWTHAGGFVGYRALADHLEQAVPGYRGKSAAAFRPFPAFRPLCDVARSLGRPGAAWTEATDYWGELGTDLAPAPDPALDALAGDKRLTHIPGRSASRPGSPGPRVLLLHDSFGYEVAQYLTTDCARLAAVGSYDLPGPVVAAERPDVVVQLLVDRTLRTRKAPAE